MVRDRGTAQTPVTDDDGLTAQAGNEEAQPSRRWPVALAVVAVIVAIALVFSNGLATLLGNSPPPTGPTGPTASPPVDTSAEGFPLAVLGLPVVTVAEAQALIEGDAVNGRALAVGGWWVPPMMASCPAPMRWMAELETYCTRNIFSSRGFASSTCTEFPDHTSCHSNEPPPGAAVIAPIIAAETSGWEAMAGAANAPAWRNTGAPAILIGHAADPRLWHCPPDTRDECAHRFVVDRVAWVAGQSLEIRPSDRQANPGMVAPEAVAAAQLAGEPLTAVALRSDQVATVDPRLHFVGNRTRWIVRALGPADPRFEGDPTFSVDEALVEDASGEVLSRTGLEMAADFRPALLLVQATQDTECCPGNVYPFYRVDQPDGTGVQEMLVGGGASSGGAFGTRHGAGEAVVLEPGDYVVTAWRSTIAADGTSGPAHDTCSIEVTVAEAQTLRIEAAFPARGACEFVEPTFANVFGG